MNQGNKIYNAWKIILAHPDEGLKTLFHGCRGSRNLKTNEWIQAEIKDVRDGSGGTWYKSGWSVFLDAKEAQDYFINQFESHKPREIIECLVSNIWKKEHSQGEMYLAEWLKIEL